MVRQSPTLLSQKVATRGVMALHCSSSGNKDTGIDCKVHLRISVNVSTAPLLLRHARSTFRASSSQRSSQSLSVSASRSTDLSEMRSASGLPPEPTRVAVSPSPSSA